MAQSITDQAIQAALDKNWHQAVECNRIILEKRPDHIPTLNRLAKAYKHLNRQKQAEKMYQRVLKLDRFNSIAKKGLESIKSPTSNKDVDINVNFVQEPGCTRTLSLKRIADQDTLHALEIGQCLKLEPKKHCINVLTGDDQYVGCIPDDISFKFKPFIKAGNTYQVSIKTIENTKVRVFIRELDRSEEFADTPTFSVV